MHMVGGSCRMDFGHNCPDRSADAFFSIENFRGTQKAKSWHLVRVPAMPTCARLAQARARPSVRYPRFADTPPSRSNVPVVGTDTDCQYPCPACLPLVRDPRVLFHACWGALSPSIPGCGCCAAAGSTTHTCLTGALAGDASGCPHEILTAGACSPVVPGSFAPRAVPVAHRPRWGTVRLCIVVQHPPPPHHAHASLHIHPHPRVLALPLLPFRRRMPHAHLHTPPHCAPTRHRVLRFMASTAAKGRAHHYIGVVTPLLSVLHGASDGDGLAERLLCSDEMIFVTSSFASQAEAVCWVTDPAQASALVEYPTGRAAALLDGRCSSGWLAALTRSSRTCLELDSAGVSAALMLMRDPAVGTCVFYWFPYHALARRWLAGADAGLLLSKVSPSGNTVASSLVKPLGMPRAGVLSPLSVAASSSTTTGTASSGSTDPAPRRDDAASPSGSRFAPRRSPSSLRSEASGLCPWRSGRGTPSPRVAAVGPFLGRRAAGIAFAPGPPVAIVEVTDEEDGVSSPRHVFSAVPSVSSSEPPMRSTKKRRTAVMVGGPGDALNPSYTTPDGWAGMLSYDEIRKCSEGALVEEELGPADAAVCSSALVPYVRSARPASREGGPIALSADVGSVPVGCRSSTANGAIGELAGQGLMAAVCDRLWERRGSVFVSGGPGTGKSTLLRRLRQYLVDRLPGDGEVVVLAPTGTSAKTAGGSTYHSFFGFVRDYTPVESDPAEEAARLLNTPRFTPIKQRLRAARAILLDEISLVNAENLDVMHALLQQCRAPSSASCLFFVFGDFLQLHPVIGRPAFAARCWVPLFGNSLLDLTVVHRQHQPDFVQAVKDARRGACTPTVLALMQERSVDGRAYDKVRDNVLHLMPRHSDVAAHNRSCLFRLHARNQRACYEAADGVVLDKDRDPNIPPPNLKNVSAFAVRAALADCVAPPTVAHGVGARVMLVDNRKKDVGLTHGSIGNITRYTKEAVAVVRFECHPLPAGPLPKGLGVVGAGGTWLEVECPRVEFTARIHSVPGAVAARVQVPFVLGWAMTIHMSQSLTVSEAVLDLARSFKAGMVNAALSRVSDKSNVYLKSFTPSRLYADPNVLRLYDEWGRL